MDKEKLIKECFILTCFLENISTEDTVRISKLISILKDYSVEQLEKYYNINLKMEEFRVNKIFKNLLNN